MPLATNDEMVVQCDAQRRSCSTDLPRYFDIACEDVEFRHAGLRKADLGHGKRQIVVGGRLDSKYQITVPEALDAGV